MILVVRDENTWWWWWCICSAPLPFRRCCMDPSLEKLPLSDIAGSFPYRPTWHLNMPGRIATEENIFEKISVICALREIWKWVGTNDFLTYLVENCSGPSPSPCPLQICYIAWWWWWWWCNVYKHDYRSLLFQIWMVMINDNYDDFLREKVMSNVE